MSERTERDPTGDIDPRTAAGRARLHRELLTANFVLVKNGLLFDGNNPVLVQSCERVARIANLTRAHNDGAAALEFLPDGVYINRQLVRLDSASYERGEYLYTVWKAFGVGEIDPLGDTQADDWLAVVGELQRCIRAGAGADALRDRTIGQVRLAALDEVHHGTGLNVSVRFRALRAYAVATLVVDDLLRRLIAERPVRLVDLKRPLQELIASADECPELLLALVHLKRHKASLAHHLVNTAVLVICMTRDIEMARSKRTELAVSACLHDIGRAFDPAEVGGDPDDYEAWCAVESTCRLVRLATTPVRFPGRVIAATELPHWANALPDEHDYPYAVGPRGQLVAIAHAYDLLTSPMPHRPATTPAEAVRLLMAEAGRRFGEVAVARLVELLGAHPVGSVVEMSTRELAIVVRAGHAADDDAWDRPTVKLVREPGGTAVDGPTLDLATDAAGGRTIVREVDAEDAGINLPAYLMT